MYVMKEKTKLQQQQHLEMNLELSKNTDYNNSSDIIS